MAWRHELTVLARQPRINCRGSTASARQPRLGSHVSAALLLRLHHRSTGLRLHHDGFASESRYDCATMVVPRQPCRYHCGTRAVLTPLHHHACAMMAWPRLGHDGFAPAVAARWHRAGGSRGSAATPPQQHRGSYATTASPCWLWLGDSASLYTRPTMTMIKALLKQMMSNTETIVT